jgi:hypothetical protein
MIAAMLIEVKPKGFSFNIPPTNQDKLKFGQIINKQLAVNYRGRGFSLFIVLKNQI